MTNYLPRWPTAIGTRYNRILGELEKQYGVTILIRDQLGALRNESGMPLFSGRVIHRSAYCKLCKNDAFARCRVHCTDEMTERAQAATKPFVSVCHGGVAEVIVPVRNEMGLVAIFYAGCFRVPDGMNKPNPTIHSAARVREYSTLPELMPDMVLGVGLILYGVGQGLISELACSDNLNEENGREAVIRAFIFANSHQLTALAQLANELSLSPSRTSHLVREITGKPFQELLLEERIRRAKALLLSTDWPLATIAERTGFATAYYFARQFSKQTGLPPGRFRHNKGRKPPSKTSG